MKSKFFKNNPHVATRAKMAHGDAPPHPSLLPASVPHIAVPVPYHPQEVKAEGQQGRAQQVPQGRQVGDGKAVGVFAAAPHGMDHPVRYTQEQQDLRRKQAVSTGTQATTGGGHVQTFTI